MKKKAIKALSIIVSALFMFNTGFVYAETDKEEEDKEDLYNAKSVVLAEAATGQILFSQNPNEKLAIASVTKIMTLLLAAEEMKAGKMSMDDTITASYNAFITDGSVIWLNEGEKMSVYDITRSIVISSANDACVALAEHLGGSEENFVKLMNKKAKDLGMNNTLFANCTGLDADNQYSTAADVAIMAAELRKYDYYDEFLLTRLSYVREGTDRATQLLNTNRLLEYNGITGLKTGTTDNAGYCFTATAERTEWSLLLWF
ncbi:MAG: D-alanyl-D-alanine carboxypeptidase [Ruminiclostridium sp.]|nr:D-alanyl-D-alanine carboxypeptidase [Ruminiclostridium sp.]